MKIRFLAALQLWLLITGCGSSIRITNSWKSPNISQKNYHTIMVVGLLPEKESNLREEMENHLVDDLRSHGCNAISSLHELGPLAFDNQTEQEVLDKIKAYGADAVVTISLLDKQRERYYVPGRIYYSPYIVYQRHFYGYYTTIYRRIYTPEYYVVNTRYFWESNFYDMDTRELLYSAQTESFDPASTGTLSHEYGQLIVGELAKNGLLR